MFKFFNIYLKSHFKLFLPSYLSIPHSTSSCSNTSPIQIFLRKSDQRIPTVWFQPHLLPFLQFSATCKITHIFISNLEKMTFRPCHCSVRNPKHPVTHPHVKFQNPLCTFCCVLMWNLYTKSQLSSFKTVRGRRHTKRQTDDTPYPYTCM